MTLAEFQEILPKPQPPSSLSPLLKALWWDAKGDWQASHNIVQDIESKGAAWVHAYLHRKEGDKFNAGYWYGKAGKKFSELSLEAEWEELVKAFIQ